MTNLRPHQGQVKALRDQGHAIPDATASFVGYISGSPNMPFHKGLRRDPRSQGRKIRDSTFHLATEGGTTETILAFSNPMQVQRGVTAAGNPSMRINPGTRGLDAKKALLAAVAKASLVIPDPVSGETVADAMQVRANIENGARSHGHLSVEVAASVELRTKRSKLVARDLLLLPPHDLKTVGILPRGSAGWDLFVELMDDMRNLELRGHRPLASKRIVLFGVPQLLPDSTTSYALAALGQGATDVIHAPPRPYVPQKDTAPIDPHARALRRPIYQAGEGVYRPAAEARTKPLMFGPSADIDALLATQPGWHQEVSRDEGFRLEARGITADWTAVRQMKRTLRKAAFPTLAPYWP